MTNINWYKKSMPKVKTVQAHIKEMAKHIAQIDGVNAVYVWGSFVKNENKPNNVLKDIDLIASTDMFSEDLTSITNDNLYSPFNLTKKQLEDEGFDPQSVGFTKQFIALKNYNIDHWAISNDKKVLHWGRMVEGRKDWDDIKKQAEDHAEYYTNLNKKKLSYSSQTQKNKWSMQYDHYISKYLSDMPLGWFNSGCDIDEVLKEAKKLI